MTAPTQRPASTSDAAKRKREREAVSPGIDYALVARIIAADPSPAEALRAFVAQEVEAAASRTPDAHLAAAKAEGVATALLALDPCQGGEEQHARHLDVCVPFHDRAQHLMTGDVLDAIDRARAARLREQGGDPVADLRAGLAEWGVEG